MELTEIDLVGKTIQEISVDRFEIELIFTDGTSFIYSVADGGYSSWDILPPRTVEAVPVVHGRWIHLDPREDTTISGKCSCCRWEAHYYEDDVADMPYCPNCGAKMDLEEQNEG